MCVGAPTVFSAQRGELRSYKQPGTRLPQFD